MKNVKKIIFLGTGSDVGKSVTATAFCRILKNRGVRVAPFKAQNMSNNSYVTAEGGEIGRAQVAQAEAAGRLPSVYMNPVLLKPCSDVGAQVVVLGKVHQTMPAREYYSFKDQLKKTVMESFEILASDCEAIVMEGAGSCSEVNLRQNDIVNFDMALSVDAPVVLVADIDRGGVFAQIIGTLAIISKEERDLIAGFIINKFRGDPKLFDDGIAYIEKKTGKPVFGLVPYYKGFGIDTEDSMSLDAAMKKVSGPVSGKINIAVLRLPHVSNFTDIEVLAGEPEVTITWLKSPESLNDFHALIIPGSKSVIHDLVVLKEAGWPRAMEQYVKNRQGFVIGLCGGYQMLGHTIEDPLGIEGNITGTSGLGLLDIKTRIEPVKMVELSEGKDRLFNARVNGYEIHMGQTVIGNSAEPFIDIAGRTDGAVSPGGQVFGTYLHGLFDCGDFRKKFLMKIAGLNNVSFDADIVRKDQWKVKDKNYDLLAEHFETYTDVDQILDTMNIV